MLTALEGVIKNAGKSLSSLVISRVYTQLKDLIYSEDDQIRSSSASILGILLQVNLNYYHYNCLTREFFTTSLEYLLLFLNSLR